jgi:hypothetical protein
MMNSTFSSVRLSHRGPSSAAMSSSASAIGSGLASAAAA